jgi:hypothetical protein
MALLTASRSCSRRSGPEISRDLKPVCGCTQTGFFICWGAFSSHRWGSRRLQPMCFVRQSAGKLPVRRERRRRVPPWNCAPRLPAPTVAGCQPPSPAPPTNSGSCEGKCLRFSAACRVSKRNRRGAGRPCRDVRERAGRSSAIACKTSSSPFPITRHAGGKLRPSNLLRCRRGRGSSNRCSCR